MELITKQEQTMYLRISAQENGMEIGHAFLYFIRNNLHEQPYAYLEDVFVVEQFRSQGTGTILLREIMDEARMRGCYKIIATSRTERQFIHDWYEKFGFKKYGLEFRLDF